MPSTMQRRLMPLGERKLMPMGNGGLVVTIPRVWARFFQLKVGDRVVLEMDSRGELRIHPKETLTLEEDSSSEEQV